STLDRPLIHDVLPHYEWGWCSYGHVKDHVAIPKSAAICRRGKAFLREAGGRWGIDISNDYSLFQWDNFDFHIRQASGNEPHVDSGRSIGSDPANLAASNVHLDEFAGGR